MNKEQRLEAWEARKTIYSGQWKVPLMGTCTQDPGYCCLSLLCPPCMSYSLRKRALYGMIDRYQCCNGFLPCSGRLGESNCPELCLATEVCCCFGTSVAVTRWMLQDELRIQNSKCDNCILGTMLFLQQLSCICQLLACITGSDELQTLADLIYFLAEIMWWSVCACLQTQHKLQMDDRDDNRGPVAVGVPPQAQPVIAPQASPAIGPPAGYPMYSGQAQTPAYPPPGYPGNQGTGFPEPMYERRLDVQHGQMNR